MAKPADAPSRFAVQIVNHRKLYPDMKMAALRVILRLKWEETALCAHAPAPKFPFNYHKQDVLILAMASVSAVARATRQR